MECFYIQTLRYRNPYIFSHNINFYPSIECIYICKKRNMHYKDCDDKTTFIRSFKGLKFLGIHSHVLRPIRTTFFLPSFFVLVVIDVKKAISLLSQQEEGGLECAVSFAVDLRFKVACCLTLVSMVRSHLYQFPYPRTQRQSNSNLNALFNTTNSRI